MRAFSGYALSFVPWWNFTPSTILASNSNARSSPAALGAHAELVDHREHSVAGQTSFRAIGPVAKLDSITFELRMWIILAP